MNKQPLIFLSFAQLTKEQHTIFPWFVFFHAHKWSWPTSSVFFVLIMPAERGIPSTLHRNKCQLGMVSKYSHHFFPKAPTLSSQSHSSRKPSTPFVERLLVTPAWPQACLAPPSPALLFNSGKSQLCARPGACTTLFTLFPTKSLLKSSLSI